MASDCKASIIVLGESGVGKTSLLIRFTRGTFKEQLSLTLIDCLHAHLNVKDKKVRLELWDTGGQDRFRTIIRQYYRKADGVLLIYDVTDITSFHRLSSWLLELRSYNEKAVVLIVGNKTDLQNNKQVSVGTVKRFAESEEMEFFETSAKNGENIYQIFEHLTLKVLEAKGILAPSPSTSSASDPSIAESSLTSGSMTNTNTTNSKLCANDVIVLDAHQGDVISLQVEEKKKKKKNSCC